MVAILMVNKILLNVNDLQISYFLGNRVAKAVDGVDFIINKGETLGLTGESGSGKSTIARSIFNLIFPPGKIVGGEIWYKDRDLLKLSPLDFNTVRGEELALIPQDPIASLDPILTSGLQSGEILEKDQEMKKELIKEKVIEYLGKVSLPDPKRRYSSYAHQLSGGMAQRVMIAAALLGIPSLLIADEPTSSLDMTIQRQILELLKDIKSNFRISMLYITHDLGVIAEMSDYVAIMYAGKIVEYADVRTIFCNPMHPYTRALLGSMLLLHKPRPRPKVIRGEPPDQFYRPNWCAFYPRCNDADSSCQQQLPPNIEVEPGHLVRCLRLEHIE